MAVDEIGVFLKGLKAFLPNRLLQFADGQRIQQVILAIHALVVSACDRKFCLGLGQRTKRMLVLHLRFAGEHFQADAFQS